MFEPIALLGLLAASPGGDYSEDLELEEEPQAIEPEAPATDAEAAQQFDALMLENTKRAARNVAVEQGYHQQTIELPSAVPIVGNEQVELPLPDFRRLRERLQAKDKRRAEAPPVVLGAARYRGEARAGALALTMELEVTLGAAGTWKTVPLIGDDVVLVSARRGGQAVPTVRRGGYQVWITDLAGEHRLELELLVPARGPKGSIEFDFRAPRTPVNQLWCRFPVPNLEPRVDGAVLSKLHGDDGGTVLEATLRPTARIRLVGFRDLGESSAQPAKLYAETLHLLSIEESNLELFVVVRYTILYGGARDFPLALPDGYQVVSADGEGAFRWAVESGERGSVLRGETELPIHGHYEISLRLGRELSKAKNEEQLRAPLVHALGAEREQGWLAIEVPGKLQLAESKREAVLPIDVRQLPPEMVDNAVSPILAAYRWHSARPVVEMTATRLPEKDPSSASIDRLRAHSVVSPEGRVLTDLKITLRNRLKPSLALDLPAGTEVRSTLLDGDPVKPSRDEAGRLILPLRRSRGGDRLEAFTLEVVLESDHPALGLAGTLGAELPAMDLPISSLSWKLDLPATHRYGALRGQSGRQSLAGHGSWHAPPAAEALEQDGEAPPAPGASADTGAMPVRFELPVGGTRVEHAEYWISSGRRVQVWTPYVRGALAAPAMTLLALLLALAAYGSARSTGQARGLGALAAIALAATMVAFGAAKLALLGAAAGAAIGHRAAVTAGARSIGAWVRGLPAAWRGRPKPEKRSFFGWLRRGVLGLVTVILALMVGGTILRVIAVLGRPFAG